MQLGEQLKNDLILTLSDSFGNEITKVKWHHVTFQPRPKLFLAAQRKEPGNEADVTCISFLYQ